MLLLQILWLLEIEDPRIDRLRSGDDIFVSVVTQLGVTRPCVGRDPVWFSGRLSRGISMWQWEVPWHDHLLEIQRNNMIIVRF